ncbi:hypothetical protein MTO96_033139 [Rhipicephalus appendiculatus]
MDLANSVFSGSRRIDLIPCTSNEGHLCNIFGDISLWNKCFWQFHLELRELAPGRLSLVEKHEAYIEACTDDNMWEEMQAVVTLLHHLLTRHHCWNLTTALLHLNHLRVLEFQYVTFNRTFIEGLSEFLVSTKSLTTLTMADQRFGCEKNAVAFVQALGRNQSITTLSLDVTPIGVESLDWQPRRPISLQYAVILADYLCGNKTLRTLSVRGGYDGRFTAVAPVVMALGQNDTLTNFSLVRLSVEDEDIELITWLLSQNQTLTSFKMIRCEVRLVSSRSYSSLAALANNKTLEELTLDLPWLKSERRSLFRSLGSNQSLKKVTLERLTDFGDISCGLRDSGVDSTFFIGTHCVLQNTVDALTECKEYSSVIVMSESFATFELLLTTLSLLPSCGHVTSLCLALQPEHFEGRASSLIAQCITGMTALRNLELSIDVTVIEDVCSKARRELAQALSANKTLRTLRVYGPWFGETEEEMLADTLQSSRTLCELYFYPWDHRGVISLMRKLSPNFSSNYSLLVIRVQRSCLINDDWFTIADVVRRNCSLVTRAAHFVMGRRLKYCAAAAELVHSNPGLVEKVQELASVDENEAALRIKTSLRSFSELNDFMRLAGVVKYGVTCHSRDGGQKQLVDIGRDCWLCIRQYLKAGDILDEQ